MANEQEIYQEPAYSIHVLELIRVAHEYCLYAEQVSDRTQGELAGFFLKIGPLLYLKGSMLPPVEVENPEANERFVTQEEYEAVFNNFRNILLPEDEFWLLDYELAVQNEPLKASLSENFADIYQDLKDFLILYQKNSQDAKQNAASECRHLFATRWGIKVMVNLRYLHYLIYRSEFSSEEDYR